MSANTYPTRPGREARAQRLAANPARTPAALGLAVLAGCAMLVAGPARADGDICEGFGPQTPRDITVTSGENPVTFPMAPPSTELNLCNIHFHNAAEHRGPGFSVAATDGKVGFQCDITATLTAAERAPYPANACNGVEPGDTIEMHWVHTSCDVEPGPGLGSCLSDACANPSLRVETQIFTVVNDEDALDFADFDYAGPGAGLAQAKAIPTGTGEPVQFLGSTTGPSFTQETCSPLQVSWSVRPQCAKVSIQSLSRWCENNVFDEIEAQGVRQLVTDPRLISPIRTGQAIAP